MQKTSKIAIIGIDAMDPRLTRKYIEQGIMPNTKKLIETGSAREDLMLLGALPTVTPPQWTTLATGCFPQTHDITAYFRLGGDIDLVQNNFTSTNCKAEQLWNVTTEAGLKTLVFHWPGSAWPPSTDSELLHVVDGSSPGGVGNSQQIEKEYLCIANVQSDVVQYRAAGMTTARVPCAASSEDEVPETINFGSNDMYALKDGFAIYTINPEVDGQAGADNLPADVAYSWIRDAEGWAAEVPEGAKEFVMLFGGGLIRRPTLILKGESGIYDHIAIYRSKKDAEPMVVIQNREYVRSIKDDGVKGDEMFEVVRDMRLLEVAPDASQVRVYVSAAMPTSTDRVLWSPKSLYEEVVEHVGYPAPTSMFGFRDFEMIYDCNHQSWNHVADYQADAMNYLMETGGYQVVFSHMHAPDLQKHMFIRNLAKGTENVTSEQYQFIMQEIYKQTDNYIGKFLHFLDEGWTIIVLSDHAQVCPKWGLRGLGDTGCNIPIMAELGYTVVPRDPETGYIPYPENFFKPDIIDWTKTTAVANREMHIYLNIKGRNQHVLPDGTIIDGIVDPADQYELEEKIITDLYGYRDKESGHRIIAWALRRKDAVPLGLGGEYPQCGDIIYCMAEGYEHDHDDSMATSLGECDTSAGPVFIAAGPGIKKGFTTTRWIKQIDIAPTMAALLGIRTPAQCEGAPAYQIIEGGDELFC